MEDLRVYQILRNLLIDGQFDMKIAEKLGQSLAIVHRQTHVGNIGEDALKDLHKHLEYEVFLNFCHFISVWES